MTELTKQVNGLCAVHCYSDDDHLCKIPLYETLFGLDYTGRQTGCGYIRSIMDTKYVITCNHIIPRRPKICEAYMRIDDNLIRLKLRIKILLYELDIAVLEIRNIRDLPDIPDFEIPGQDLNSSKVNQIIKTIFDPETNSLTQDIKQFCNNVNLCYDRINSTIFRDFPLYWFDPSGWDQFTNNFNESEKEPVQEHQKSKYNSIANMMKSFSGSIVEMPDGEKGMIQLCRGNSDGSNIRIMSIPLELVNFICDKMIHKNMDKLVGIHINTNFAREQDNIQYHQVTAQTCRYANGKREFSFNENDQILMIDGKKFNEDGLINFDSIQIPLKLNTFLLLSSLRNFSSFNSHDVKIYYKRKTDKKYQNVILSGIPYDAIYTCRPNFNRYVETSNHIFMELSEEMITLLKINGQPIDHLVSFVAKYSLAGESTNTIVLIPKKYVWSPDFFSLVVEKIGKYKIKNISSAAQAIGLNGHRKTLKVTIFNQSAKEQIEIN